MIEFIVGEGTIQDLVTLMDDHCDRAIKRNHTNIALTLISFEAMCHTQRCIEDAVKNNNQRGAEVTAKIKQLASPEMLDLINSF